MKNLARLILALFATQLLVAGIACAAVTNSSAADQKSPVSVMPEDDPPSEGF